MQACKALIKLIESTLNCLTVPANLAPNAMPALVHHHVLKTATPFLIKDALVSYKLANTAMGNLFGRFFALPLTTASDALLITKRFIHVSGKMDEMLKEVLHA
jgi:hypothetical protein